MPPFGDRHLKRFTRYAHGLQKPVCGEIAADLAHLVAEHRIVFDPMPVAIDDRMVDFRTDLLRGHMCAHDLLRKVTVGPPVILSPPQAIANHDLPARPAPSACMPLQMIWSRKPATCRPSLRDAREQKSARSPPYLCRD